MALKHLLGFCTIILFLAYFHGSKNKNRAYILFVLALFPFIDLHITTEQFGTLSVFDAISYYILLFRIKDFVSNFNLKRIYYILFFSLAITLFIGSLQSDFVSNSLISGLKYLSVFIYGKMLIDEYKNDPAFSRLVLKFLKIICLFSVVFFFIQLKEGLGFTFYPNLNPNTQVEGLIRYPSFFFDPQVYAQFLAMCSFLFLIAINTAPLKTQFYNIALFLLIVFVIFMTGGRAGLLGFCAGLFILFISGKNKFRLFVATCCLAGYIAVISFPQSFAVFNRDEGVNDSFAIRSQIWREGWQVFSSNPLWGVGIGNYTSFNLRHFSFNGYYLINNEVVYYGTENGYLNILAECGISGLLSILLIVTTPLITSIKLYIGKKVNYNIFFLVASTFAWMIAFITTNTLDDKRTVVLLATILCLLISLNHSPQKNHA